MLMIWSLQFAGQLEMYERVSHCSMNGTAHLIYHVLFWPLTICVGIHSPKQGL